MLLNDFLLFVERVAKTNSQLFKKVQSSSLPADTAAVALLTKLWKSLFVMLYLIFISVLSSISNVSIRSSAMSSFLSIKVKTHAKNKAYSWRSPTRSNAFPRSACIYLRKCSRHIHCIAWFLLVNGYPLFSVPLLICNNFYLPRIRSNFGKEFLSYKGFVKWNYLKTNRHETINLLLLHKQIWIIEFLSQNISILQGLTEKWAFWINNNYFLLPTENCTFIEYCFKYFHVIYQTRERVFRQISKHPEEI